MGGEEGWVPSAPKERKGITVEIVRPVIQTMIVEPDAETAALAKPVKREEMEGVAVTAVPVVVPSSDSTEQYQCQIT